MNLYQIFPGFRMSLLISCLLIGSLCAKGQVPGIIWQQSYGGASNENSYCIQRTLSGGYVIAGYTESAAGDVTGYIGSGDFWIVNTDSAGNILWQQCYGGTYPETPHSIRQTADSGFVIAGQTYSVDGEVVGNHGNNDYWIVKVDKNGLLMWQKPLGGSDVDMIQAMTATFDGGFVVAGFSFSHDGDVTGLHGLTTCDEWVVKLNDTGGIQWQKTYGGTGNDVAYDIIQTADSSYVLAGYTASYDGDVTYNHGYADMWVLKINDTGRLQWQKTYGGSSIEFAYSIRQAPDGGYIVGGSTSSSNGDVTNYRGGIYYGDFWAVKIDDTGKLQWQKTYGGIKDENIQSVLTAQGGGYMLAGWTNSSDGDVTFKHDTSDYWVVKVDDTGAIEWQRTLGGSGVDFAQNIIQCSNGHYVITGSSTSADWDITGHHNGSDIWVAELGVLPDAVSLLSKPGSQPNVFPNYTASGLIHVVMPVGYESAVITLSNMQGQSIKIDQGQGTKRDIQIPANAPPGMYLLQIQSNSQKSFYKIILQ